MTRRILATLTIGGLVSLFWACGNTINDDGSAIGEEDVSSIEARLEQDNGGFDMQDESIFFEPDDLFLPTDFDYDRDTIMNPEEFISDLGELPEGIEHEALAPPTGDGSADKPLPPPAIGKNQAEPNKARPLPPCPKLLMLGKWKAVKKGFGVFRGVVVVPTPMLENKKGVVVGFMKGIWGKGRFIGKAVRRGGKGWALVKGLYGHGHFKGRLRTPAGIRGALHGRYGPSGRYIGMKKIFCAPDCQKACPNNFSILSDGGCVCHPKPCPEGKVLDICPKLLEVCVSVSELPKDNAAAAPDHVRCKVTCAPPVCRQPRPKCCRPCPEGVNCPDICIPAPCPDPVGSTPPDPANAPAAEEPALN